MQRSGPVQRSGRVQRSGLVQRSGSESRDGAGHRERRSDDTEHGSMTDRRFGTGLAGGPQPQERRERTRHEQIRSDVEPDQSE